LESKSRLSEISVAEGQGKELTKDFKAEQNLFQPEKPGKFWKRAVLSGW
jgi:hypothetical protein